MMLVEKVTRGTFVVLFGVLFSGVFVLLALETALRRWRDDRRAELEPPESDLEAAYRRRPKTRPTVERPALPPLSPSR
jgi:hypothetical protein